MRNEETVDKFYHIQRNDKFQSTEGFCKKIFLILVFLDFQRMVKLCRTITHLFEFTTNLSQKQSQLKRSMTKLATQHCNIRKFNLTAFPSEQIIQALALPVRTSVPNFLGFFNDEYFLLQKTYAMTFLQSRQLSIHCIKFSCIVLLRWFILLEILY